MTIGSTYRVQLRPRWGFTEAAALADYLRDLGVDALYASPMLTPTPGSQHGYDVVDPTAANPELGGESGRRALVHALRDNDLRLVADIVPNHMAVAVPAANAWWWDVLANGESSQYAHFFDIDWTTGPLLLPVLGEDAAVAELTVSDGRLHYYEHEFPIADGTESGTPQEIHDRQHYRLVSWRRGNTELNYRRFFDVTTLAAVRVEDEDVFAHTHAEPLRWVRDGDVQGLRVDHPDGLSDPGEYLRRLSDAAGVNCWLVVEKILEPGEALPAAWPVDGTTGYDALREICGVFVDTTATGALTDLADSLGVATDYTSVLAESRDVVTTQMLVAEVDRAARLLVGVPHEHAKRAVAEVFAAFGVYRSYLPVGERNWADAVRRVRTTWPELAEAVDALDGQVRDEPAGELARRMQQTSGMVVAKGTEDTAFYRYTRFVAANEVGGSPTEIGVDVAEFHAAAAAREAGSPRTMTTLSTHDTKRSEDVRARLAVLAEMPDEFGAAVRRWSERAPLPEPSLNLLAWQSLLGTWPISEHRLRDYLDKASKEAKLRTSWLRRDPEFERAVDEWPAKVLGDPELVADIERFVSHIRQPGWSNSLGQKLLQLTGPGVPDVYQGTELWDYSLVDPDNRRDVDFAVRRKLLAALRSGELPEVDDSGAAKLHVVRTALNLRRDRPDRFRGYRALSADGPAAEHLVGFLRTDLVAVATRLPVRLLREGGWRDTTLSLPPGTWTDRLSGNSFHSTIHCGQLLERYPVALLERS